MAGPACKVIINELTRAISESLERVLTMDWVRGKLPAGEADRLLQRLADVDLAAYDGGTLPAGGLGGIVLELEGHGIFTSEVWHILRRPQPQ